MFKKPRENLSRHAQRAHDQAVTARVQAAKARITARNTEERIIVPSFSTMILLHLEKTMIQAIANVQAGVVSDVVVFAMRPVQECIRFLLMLVLLGLDSIRSVMRVDEEMQRLTASCRLYRERNHIPLTVQQISYSPSELLDPSAPSSPVPFACSPVDSPKSHSVSAAVQTVDSSLANPSENVDIRPSSSETVFKKRSKIPVRVRITSSPSSLMVQPDSPNLQLRRITGQRDLLDSNSRGPSAPTSPHLEFASLHDQKQCDFLSSSVATLPVYHHRKSQASSHSGSSYSRREARHDESFHSPIFRQSTKHGEGASLSRASSSGSLSRISKESAPTTPIPRLCNMSGFQSRETRQSKTPLIKGTKRDITISTKD